MLLAQPFDPVQSTSTPRLLSRYSALADILLRGTDMVAILICALVSYWILFSSAVPPTTYKIAMGFVALYAVICFASFPLYRSWRGRNWTQEIGVLSLAWVSTFLLFSAHMFLIKWGDVFSRRWLVLWFIGGLLTLVSSRVVLRYGLNILRENGIDVQRVIGVGLRHPMLKVHQHLQKNAWMGMDVIGYFKTPYDVNSHETPNALPCLGEMKQLERYLKRQHVDQVWISMPLGEKDRLKEVLHVLDRYPLQVKLLPDLFDFGMLNQSGEQLGNIPAINLRQGAVDRDNYFVIAKAIQDKIVAGLALLILWPVFLMIAVAIKATSPGPVFFKQVRHGLNGREFKMLKFRSMRVMADNAPVVQATENDPRVTKVGRFLRKTSLDELPQFINVLLGNMSVVGPRPHAKEHNSHYENLIHSYMQRHYVKPGITGWAQVNGFRGETIELRTMKKRVQYDLDYIRRWSIWLDLKIIALTAFRVLRQKTAY